MLSSTVLFAACALFAETPLAASADYYAIDGAYTIADAVEGQCNLSPTNKPMQPQPGCSSVQGPDVDLKHSNNYLGAALPDSLILSLADLNNAEFAGSAQKNADHFNNWIGWYPRTNSSVSKQTTYFHKTRCGDGEGEHVTTDKRLYKKCRSALPGVNNTFHLPASVCLETCDEDISCVGYTIDEAGALCSILQQKEGQYIVYQLIGENTKGSTLNNGTQQHNGRTAESKNKSEAILAHPISVPSDYFAVDGAYYGLGNDGICIVVDNGTLPGAIGCPNSYGPEIDHQAKLIYPRPFLPENTLLTLADLNNAEQIQGRPSVEASGLYANKLVWHPRTASTASKQTTYIHKTRCGNGVTGEHITTDKNAYKKCTGPNTVMGLKNEFHLPPNVCETTCEKETDCVGYTIDTTGANCWILHMVPPGVVETDQELTMYWLIGPVPTTYLCDTANLKCVENTAGTQTKDQCEAVCHHFA
jgi:hypothetical protein